MAKEHVRAKRVKDTVEQTAQRLKMACDEAKKQWYALIAQHDQATRDLESVEVVVSQASNAERTAMSEFEDAQQQESQAKSQREEIERRLNGARVAEDVHHNAGLEETIKRMEEIRLQEEQDRAAKEAKARADRQREEKAKAEEARRREEERVRYAEAVRQEQERWRQRDARFFSASAPASWDTYADWLSEAGEDFERKTFTLSEPLTIESIPWPVVRRQGRMALPDVTWDAVEHFFRYLQAYKGPIVMSLLKATQLRFHPDRWKSRRLLVTVLDEELKRELDKAGNIVSQASTALVNDFQQHKS